MKKQSARITGRSLERLVAVAVGAGAPSEVAEEARAVTLRRFGHEATSRERAEAYFWGVVRRRALGGSAPRLVASLLAASMADDLIEAGHRPDVVSQRVALAYGESTRRGVLAADGGRAA
jgi:hypothetical protein